MLSRQVAQLYDKEKPFNDSLTSPEVSCCAIHTVIEELHSSRLQMTWKPTSYQPNNNFNIQLQHLYIIKMIIITVLMP